MDALLANLTDITELVVWCQWRMSNLIWWEMWANPKKGVYLTSFDIRSLEQDRNAWIEWRRHADSRVWDETSY